MSRTNISLLWIPVVVLLAFFLWSCSEDDDTTNPIGPEPTTDMTATCVGCHTSDTMLQETAEPDDTPPGDPSGEG